LIIFINSGAEAGFIKSFLKGTNDRLNDRVLLAFTANGIELASWHLVEIIGHNPSFYNRRNMLNDWYQPYHSRHIKTVDLLSEVMIAMKLFVQSMDPIAILLPVGQNTTYPLAAALACHNEGIPIFVTPTEAYTSTPEHEYLIGVARSVVSNLEELKTAVKKLC